LRATSTSSRA